MALSAIILAIAAFFPSIAAAETITVRAGPDGEIQVSAPWGDYAVVDEGGAYWVGTQREFDRQRVIAISQQHGSRLSTVDAAGADATFVSEATLRTHVGSVAIDSVAPSIMFGLDPRHPPRPTIPKTSEYVSVMWIQQGSAQMPLLLFVDKRTGRAIRPYFTGTSDAWYVSEFAVPRSELTRQVIMLFVLPNRKPGPIPLRSIAWADYKITKTTNADIGLSPEEHLQLKRLRKLDPSLER